VLGSSPLALLAWIGEKFLAWSDDDPNIEKILEDVTLYWLTETFPTSIYPYRAVSSPANMTTRASFLIWRGYINILI
jgi:microsomal epoxide hydrolase